TRVVTKLSEHSRSGDFGDRPRILYLQEFGVCPRSTHEVDARPSDFFYAVRKLKCTRGTKNDESVNQISSVGRFIILCSSRTLQFSNCIKEIRRTSVHFV